MVYTIIKLFFPIIEKLFIKKISGAENIPSYGPFILAANHQSHLDGFLIAGYVVKKTDQPVHFLAKREFTSYFGSGIENLVYKKWAHCILVEKEGTKAKGKLAIAEAAATLEDDGIVGIFPEGTRTYDGSLQEGRTGVVRIVLEAQKHLKRNIQIIPVGIQGANIMLPREKIIPRAWKSQVTIKVGKPFYMKTTQKKKMTKALLRKQTTVIMKKIAQCAGERYAP
ncbi:1-acyl-sn-glycerol-3-phosphate acyltransferase [Candidatus Woesearchaeota archaeon]|nr:1-acyl-sn-glycerol-3-phosphate acyltransferase [Candidatus Woesearchaeota archaeon]